MYITAIELAAMQRKRQATLIPTAISALLFTGAVSHAAETGTSRCNDLKSTYDTLTCYSQEMEKADRQMDAYYDAVGKSLARLDPQVNNQMSPELTKDSFLLYRKIECQNAGAVFAGGWMSSVLTAQCYIELTHERTHRIWKDFLALPAMGEPFLVEPK